MRMNLSREEALELIARYRDQIDDVDRRLVDLLNERTGIVEKLGRVKEELDLPIYEPRREDDVFANVTAANAGPLPPEALKRLFERIVDEMRSLQRINRAKTEKAEPGG